MRVQIIQIFQVQRSIEVDLDTEVELAGESASPSFDDPKWADSWQLLEEHRTHPDLDGPQG